MRVWSSRQWLHRPQRRSLHAPTIYALSTAPGRAAIAVVRVSGPACRDVYSALCPSAALPPPRTAALRRLYRPLTAPSPASVLDSALVLFFPRPRTFTGDDVLELHIHGGPAVVRAVLAAVPASTAHPVRYAEPGEFTRRAFANGRLDLPQIESLGDTLAADTEQQRRIAVRGTASRLAARYEQWRARLLAARGELEALIDFAEDQHFDESPAHLCASVAAQVRVLRALIHAHVANAVRGELLRSGIRMALLGAPNAGKSSLLNRIVGRDAAIVSHEAGTTRDIVDVTIDLAGYLVNIGDMAGLRAAHGAVEQEGIKRAKQRALESDVLVVVQDATANIDPDVAETTRQCLDVGISVVVAVNKTDQLDPAHDFKDAWRDRIRDALAIPPSHVAFISCKHSTATTAPATTTPATTNPSTTTTATTNPSTTTPPTTTPPTTTPATTSPPTIQPLLATLTQTFTSLTTALVPDSDPDPDPSLWQESLGATERQRILLSDTLTHLDAFLDAVEKNDTDVDVDIVLAAEELRSAADALARITGRGEAGDVEEVLGVVFEKFCVGK